MRERREGVSRWRSAVGKDGRSGVGAREEGPGGERAPHPGRPPGRRGGVDRARLRDCPRAAANTAACGHESGAAERSAPEI